MTRICFVDTETTSLRTDRRAWEIAIITRGPGDDDIETTEYLWRIKAMDLDLGNADLQSLRIGRFHERHPQMTGSRRYSGDAEDEGDTLWEIERITRGAHLCGNVVNFDAEVLDARMRAHGITPSWHYHLIDVEALAVGYLAASGRGRTPAGWAAPPWDSEAISRELGVSPERFDRHTALGDARWAAAVYDAVAGAAAPA